MGSVISAIIAIAKAVPALKDLFDQISTIWVRERIDSMRKDQQEALRNAIKLQDQRELERAIGNPTAGQPSGIPGTEIRERLPGVSDFNGA